MACVRGARPMDHLAAYADSDEEAPAAPRANAAADASGAAAPAAAPAATEQSAAAAPSVQLAQHTQSSVAGQTPPPTLPNDGWVEYKTAQGASYYYHIPTRATSWDRPAAFRDAHATAAVGAPPSSAAPPAKPAATAPRKPVSWCAASCVLSAR